MTVSAFELFSIGIGPSSSHTVGPMRAARRFAEGLEAYGLESVTRLRIELFGSLGATGRGHATDTAVILGLTGEDPATVSVAQVPALLEEVRATGRVTLLRRHPVPFVEGEDLVFAGFTRLPRHPNALTFTAWGSDGAVLAIETYYSIGGGFIERDGDAEARGDRLGAVPHPFSTAAELLAICESTGLAVSDVVRANERTVATDGEIDEGLDAIWQAMSECVAAGCENEGELPGGLRVQRRAPGLHRRLQAADTADPLTVMDWVNVFAMAVNEENAAGGRVVTAPTNGAAGILPAVLHYYVRFVDTASAEGIRRFLLTAAAIGAVIKSTASISGAEMGCQGEVGSACAMAAGALCELLGGSPQQVENAAEIGLEHNLGLTCDPVGGLVQIPCIERNAIGAVKAINAARIAMAGDGTHRVSLDQAVATLRDTGNDMLAKYKETSLGGLAVNVVEC